MSLLCFEEGKRIKANGIVYVLRTIEHHSWVIYSRVSSKKRHTIVVGYQDSQCMPRRHHDTNSLVGEK